MAALYTDIDQLAIGQHQIGLSIVDASAGLNQNGISSKDFIPIKFQFPPKFSDNRSLGWSEKPTRGIEPMAVIGENGPSARAINMKWQYMVDGNQWTIEIIREQLRLLRGYFIAARRTIDDSGMIVKFYCYFIGGNSVMTGRLKDVSIDYSKALVSGISPTPTRANPNLIDNSFFPLLSTVSTTVHLWSRGNALISSGNRQTVRNDQGNLVALQQQIKGLEETIPPSWY